MARNMAAMFDLQRNLDCVFCVDTTGSMDPWIKATLSTVKQLNETITKETSAQSVRFGFVAYRDHPPEESTYVIKIKPLTE